MRRMGDLAGVEIEPEQQTHLLDRSIAQPGVIGGGVPGGQSCSFTSWTYGILTREQCSWRI